MSRRWQTRTYDPALPELRRRTAWLLRGQDPKIRAFVQLLPLLLCGRFRRPHLDRDAPGVRLAPRRHRWGHLCSQLDLPPPFGVTTTRPLIRSVILAPNADGHLELMILPVDEINNSDAPRLFDRVDAITSLASRQCPRLEVRLVTRAELVPALIPWVAVCAGELPPFDEGPVDRRELVARAPTRLARCLALLVGDDAAPPLEVLRVAPGPARPESFLARWTESPLIRAVARLDPKDLAALMETSAALQQACAFALKRMPLRERAPLRALVRHDLFSSAVPGVLRHVLEAGLHGHEAIERHDGGQWRLSVDGVILARAPTLDQLRANAVTQTPLLARANTPWGRVAQLPATNSHRTLVIIEAGALKHLVVSICGSRRLKARRVDVQGLLRFALLARARNEPAEVLASLGSDQSLVSRIAQISRMPCRGPSGVEAGHHLLLATPHHIREPLLRAALARPRHLQWLPSDPELGRSLRTPPAVPLLTIHATAWPLSEHSVALYFLDPSGTVLREEVPRAALEPHLVESRELVRAARPSALLSVTVHPQLTALAGRRLDAELPVVPIEVQCDWPYTLRVWLDGEAFCAPGDLSWSALSEAILSHWPPGTWGRVGIRQVGFIRPPPQPSPLDVLALRSRVLRRITSGLRRLTRVLEAA